MEEFELVQKVIVELRNIRAERKIEPKRKVAAEFYSSKAEIKEAVQRNLEGIVRLAVLSELKFLTDAIPPGSATRSTANFDLGIDPAAAAATNVNARVIDASAEQARVRKEIERVTKDIASKQRQLGDETFRNRAPENIIQGMEWTLKERRVELKKLRERLAQFEGGADPA